MVFNDYIPALFAYLSNLPLLDFAETVFFFQEQEFHESHILNVSSSISTMGVVDTFTLYCFSLF